MSFLPENIPPFHHPEITVLYQKGPRIEAAELQNILALPQPTLVQDLEGILTDTKQRYPYYENLLEEELEEEFLDAPLHAIMLLGEVQSNTSLPAILAWLSQPDEVVDFWLGDHKTETIWEAFYKLLPNDRQVIDAFLRNPSVDMSIKTTLTDAFTQLALHQPQHRNEAVKMYIDLFDYYKGTEKEDDKEFLSFAVGSALEMKATELISQITALYDAGVVYEYVNGNKKEALKILSKDEKDYTRTILPITDRYQEIVTTWAGYTDTHEDVEGAAFEDEIEEEDADWIPELRGKDEDESELIPVRTEPKIGRNDPCPCGSGKKYKKCCMNA